MAAENAPADIAGMLEPGEGVERTFRMDGGLEVYATAGRLLCRRRGAVAVVSYDTIRDLRYRVSRGVPQLAAGSGFVAAGSVMGFEGVLAAGASVLLFAIGATFLALGLARKRARVEFRLTGEEPGRLSLVAVLLPFLLFLRAAKRYQVRGHPDTVQGFYVFVRDRLPGGPPAV